MMRLSWIMSQSSFLSPEVKDLLQKATPASSGQVADSNSISWIRRDCGIVWQKVEELFTDIKEENGSKIWFCEAVVKMASLFGHCHNSLKNLTQDEYSVNISPFLEWTNQIYEGSCNSGHLVALLTITAVTERALGNLVLTKREQVPFLLRDLLVTEELQEILGPTRVQVLRVLLGSVLGINLRNIAWHGFLSPCEANPAFVATIIIILADCGRLLRDYQVVNVPCRPVMSFTEAVSLSSVFEEVAIPPRPVMEELITKSPLVPAIMTPAWMKALDLLTAKKWGLCVVLLLPMLECSLRCLFAYANEVSDRVLTAENSTLYTTLDEILQPTVCKVIHNQSVEQHNQYSSHRNSGSNIDTSAEQHDKPPLTVGMVEILNSNLVLHFVGKKLNEALHDLLNFVQGPRVRDRVSHGEVKFDQIPQSVAHHTLYLSLLVLSLGNWRSRCKRTLICKTLSCISTKNIDSSEPGEDKMCCDMKQKNNEKEAGTGNCEMNVCVCGINLDSIAVSEASENLINLVKVLSGCIEKYKSFYHPTAIFHKKLLSSVTQLSEWRTWERADCSELDYDDWESQISVSLELPQMITFPPFNITHKVVSLDNVQEFISQICSINYEVLYRPKPEIEVVSMLHRIILNVQSALDNICENLAIKYSHYVQKQLRSRQRETYRRQLNAIPTVIMNCYLTVQFIHLLFLSVNRIDQLSKSCVHNLLKVLKAVLKVQENVVSQTNVNANRWDEAMCISLQNMKVIRQKYSV
ncbi:endoplasmic reticulum membrane-associated RNA degradation protein-like isoform X2 [Homarus americanus]|uniref:endoplasmic reticulum membrane-associated RNA degradation protein-like isoform X2 n=1 Tax=Homarus americanus TaxID=6706 RepID=UPI001C4457B3|nr:endoplasmic reticulum membrane-associated RNA degradation protein-like isoform X2 [Homarus americanus]